MDAVFSYFHASESPGRVSYKRLFLFIYLVFWQGMLGFCINHVTCTCDDTVLTIGGLRPSSSS